MAFGGEQRPGGRTQGLIQNHARTKVTHVNGAQFSGPSTEPEVSEGSDHLGIVVDGIAAKCQQSFVSFRSSAERGAFDNLILLCSACHTIIDKAEHDFPDQLLASWKRDHEERLAKIFGAVHLGSRA